MGRRKKTFGVNVFGRAAGGWGKVGGQGAVRTDLAVGLCGWSVMYEYVLIKLLWCIFLGRAFLYKIEKI